MANVETNEYKCGVPCGLHAHREHTADGRRVLRVAAVSSFRITATNDECSGGGGIGIYKEWGINNDTDFFYFLVSRILNSAVMHVQVRERRER